MGTILTHIVAFQDPPKIMGVETDFLLVAHIEPSEKRFVAV